MDDRVALAAMAAFLPRLMQPGISVGKLVAPGKGPDGTWSMPYWAYSDLVSDFVDMAYRTGWVECPDWVAWSDTADGRRLLSEQDAVAGADLDQLRCLVTALIRKDRFCDGTLAEAFDAGLVLRVVARAQQLLAEGCSTKTATLTSVAEPAMPQTRSNPATSVKAKCSSIPPQRRCCRGENHQ